MKVPLSWIREFVDVPESADDIGTLMSVRGLALEGLERDGDETVLDFDVTANRPDCLSVIGIAREIATAYGRPLKTAAGQTAAGTKVPALRPDGSDTPAIPVTIDAPDLCRRYVAAVADVVVGPSPAWMQARLNACGVRPISNIVDITNYVLLELGQPMHAFDLEKLAGRAITVRRARANEGITTLDGKTRKLAGEMLVIADAGRAQAIGGVMGGADSEVTGTTRQIVFESAWFAPGSVRVTSKALGLRSEASIRFERGADLTAPSRGMARACELLEQIGAGKRISGVTDTYPAAHEPVTMTIDSRRIDGLLGMTVPAAAVTRILASLGFDVVPAGDDSWTVTVPAWRVDIRRPVDLIEEVGRHHGFEHLPATFPGVQQAPEPSDPRLARDRRARTAALGMGFSEAITFAFIEAAAAEPFQDGLAPVALANPLSEKFAVMRPSLLPGLVDAVSHNRRHGHRDVRLFEIGTRFTPSGESRGLGLAWTGLATADHWSGGRRDVDFSDIKGVVEQLAAAAGAQASYVEAEAPYLVRGRAAALMVDGRRAGTFGLLEPAVGDRRDLPAGDQVYVAELDLDALARSHVEPLRATTLPRFPSVVRDVSILVDDALSAEKVRGTIRSAAPGTLVLTREFDRYDGKGVPDGKVSLSFRLTFQSPERTLTDDEVQDAMQRILDALTRELGAIQR